MANHEKHRAYLYMACMFLSFGTLKETVASQQAGVSIDENDKAVELTVNAERQIALDIVSVLTQVQGMGPGTTTLYMLPPQDTFAANLGHFLDLSGYNVVLDEDINSSNFISYSILDKSSLQNTAMTYQVNIGQLKLRRDYAISENVALPQTAMFIQGADIAEIQLNEEIFNSTSTVQYETVESPSDKNPQSTAELSVVTSDSKNTYQTGEPIVLSLSINYESRIYCYYKDGHGQIVKIFPNRFNSANQLNANENVVIPGNDNWSINATRVGATDDFLCIATDPENESLVSVLEGEPDFEPMAARNLDEISQRISADPNAPVITTSLSVQVN